MSACLQVLSLLVPPQEPQRFRRRGEASLSHRVLGALVGVAAHQMHRQAAFWWALGVRVTFYPQRREWVALRGSPFLAQTSLVTRLLVVEEPLPSLRGQALGVQVAAQALVGYQPGQAEFLFQEQTLTAQAALPSMAIDLAQVVLVVSQATVPSQVELLTSKRVRPAAVFQQALVSLTCQSASLAAM